MSRQVIPLAKKCVKWTRSQHGLLTGKLITCSKNLPSMSPLPLNGRGYPYTSDVNDEKEIVYPDSELLTRDEIEEAQDDWRNEDGKRLFRPRTATGAARNARIARKPNEIMGGTTGERNEAADQLLRRLGVRKNSK